MVSGLHHDHPVRREWLPSFTIVWMTVSSLLVIIRLALRIGGRSSTLGLDDVFGSILLT